LRPEFDVAEVTIRWGGKLRELPPQSLSASTLQCVLGIATVPLAKLLSPSILYQPELAPSAEALITVLAASGLSGGLVYWMWSGRIGLRAPAEQQREAEEQA
jgi:hypothetical protein